MYTMKAGALVCSSLVSALSPQAFNKYLHSAMCLISTEKHESRKVASTQGWSSVKDPFQLGPNKGPPALCLLIQQNKIKLVQKQRKAAALVTDWRGGGSCSRADALPNQRPWAGLLCRDLVSREGSGALPVQVKVPAQRLRTWPAAAILNCSVVCRLLHTARRAEVSAQPFHRRNPSMMCWVRGLCTRRPVSK